MTFDIANTLSTIKDSTSGKITPGIWNATFDSIVKDTITTQDGRDLNVLRLTVALDNGTTYSNNWFEPTSTERKDGVYGPNPSQCDQFVVAIKEILQALNPSYTDDIESGKLKLGGSFTQLVKALSDYTAQYKGAATQIKLVPNSKGYVGVPSYPAMITKNGELAMATRFIGDNLTLNAKEERLIKAAAVAKPTVMEKPAIDLSDISADLGKEISSTEENFDMPF